MRPCDAALLLWWAICAGACFLAATVVGQAVSLSITGNSTGQGFQNFSFAGDDLNVSILANTFGCFWNVTGALP
ncbi:hypothetical protein M0R72_19895 [Candidatus Pacearchaeota archaeon]|jgi:hypothetical protein|nr:hypothetical protein [Candidatus Pacearchaeota archaeon]